MRSCRGLAGLVTVVFAGQLPAAVELLADVGLSRTRRDDGVPVVIAALQPGLLAHSDDPWFFTGGVRAGPALLFDPDTRERAVAIEARLLAGAGWSARQVRLDLLASWGGGFWHDSGAGVDDGWGRSVGAEALATWSLNERTRGGPSASWSLRQLGNVEIEDWRLAIALIYRLD